MGASPTLLSNLRQFRQRLESSLGSVQVVLLFGSQARGSTHEYSDIDLLVVSDTFRGKSYVARAWSVRKAWKLSHPVDFLCYTPEEFEKLRHQATIVRDAVREGVEVPA